MTALFPSIDSDPPEPGAAARAFLAGPHQLLIGGERVTGAGRPIAVENPARGTIIAEVRAASLGQLDEAVSAARTALNGDWGRISGTIAGCCSRVSPTCSIPMPTLSAK